MRLEITNPLLSQYPTVKFSTYPAGAGHDEANAIDVDTSGNMNIAAARFPPISLEGRTPSPAATTGM